MFWEGEGETAGQSRSKEKGGSRGGGGRWEGAGGGTGVEEIERRGRCFGMNVSSAVTVADGA